MRPLRKVFARTSSYLLWPLAFLLTAAPGFAHVGSPDVYFDGHAGPYQLMVTVRPPAMIPGIAQVEVRSNAPGIQSVQAVPLYIVGEGSKYPPVPDTLRQSKDDPQLFTGQIWIMGSGSWQVRLKATGAQGPGSVAVPVPAFATRTLPMQKALGAFLFAVMLLLVAAFVSIVGAGSREGFLDPGEKAGPKQSRRGAIVMAIAAVLLVTILFLANGWWNSEASGRALGMIYKPPPLAVTLHPAGLLALRIGESQWHSRRDQTVMTALIPDHGHLMHLFLVRWPQMDRFYHLHPERTEDQVFAQQLPALPAGHYQIFADIVRASGFPDTMTAEIDLPDIQAGATSGDDSQATAPALSGSLQSTNVSALSGGRMVWERDSAAIRAGRPMWFRFRVEDQPGKPAQDLEPYMGMAGHAEFLSFDRTVFAHVHPEGSVAMAALALANPSAGKTDAMANMPHAFSEVSFPYGFPKPGDYRLFIQVKRAGQVQTGIFDVKVEP